MLVTADFSMPMTLSVDLPTLPRLQYLSERSGHWVVKQQRGGQCQQDHTAGSYVHRMLPYMAHAAMSCKGL